MIPVKVKYQLAIAVYLLISVKDGVFFPANISLQNAITLSNKSR